MARTEYYYGFIFRDASSDSAAVVHLQPYRVHAAMAQLHYLKRGFLVGPITRIPIPAMPTKKRKAKK